MKQKTLLLLLVLLTGSFFSSTAQEVLISESISSQAWQDELARLNPGQDEFGVLINPNATNIVAFTTPAAGGSYTNMNSTDLYFNKYKLTGAIEVKPTLPCPIDGKTHAYGGDRDVAFRLQNSALGMIEFPEIASAGLVTLHIRNGNANNATTVALEKYESETWTLVHAFDLQGNAAFDATYRDEVVTRNVDLAGPVKLRLINNHSATKRFINLYEVEILSRVPQSVGTIKSIPFKYYGRKLISEKPVTISLYNTLGSLVYEQKMERELEIPASIGKGIFVVKSALGTQKLILR